MLSQDMATLAGNLLCQDDNLAIAAGSAGTQFSNSLARAAWVGFI